MQTYAMFDKTEHDVKAMCYIITLKSHLLKRHIQSI